MTDVLTIIRNEATKDRVDPALAEAIARVEDPSLDPNAAGDRGYFVAGRFVADPSGPPTSFGLYQLHENGLLGSLTPAQASNPQINAHVALTHLYQTEQGHPSVRDPGTLAALSQGPADPIGYAAKIDDLIGHKISRGDRGPSVPQSTLPPGPFSDSPIAHAGEAIWGAVTSPFELAKKIWDALTSSGTWIRVGLFVGGAILVLLGLYRVFGGSSGAPIPIPV